MLICDGTKFDSVPFDEFRLFAFKFYDYGVRKNYNSCRDAFPFERKREDAKIDNEMEKTMQEFYEFSRKLVREVK